MPRDLSGKEPACPATGSFWLAALRLDRLREKLPGPALGAQPDFTGPALGLRFFWPAWRIPLARPAFPRPAKFNFDISG